MKKMMSRGIAAASTAAMFPAGAAWAQAPSDVGYPCGPHMMSWGGGWSAMFFGPLFMILVLVALIAIAVLLVRWLGGPWRGTTPPHDSQQGSAPLDILKQRYARGEIDKEEFEERRRVLGE